MFLKILIKIINYEDLISWHWYFKHNEWYNRKQLFSPPKST